MAHALTLRVERCDATDSPRCQQRRRESDYDVHMKIVKFVIENFRGIERCQVDLQPGGAGVFTLIGLNESGKTTILEALETFSLIKEERGGLYGVASDDVNPATYVPKHLKSNFSGRVAVTATVSFEPGEKAQIIRVVEAALGCSIEPDSIPKAMDIVRGFEFENSDFKKKIYYWPKFDLMGRAKGGRKTRKIEFGEEIYTALLREISNRIPQIIYFPTFLFVQPEKIILNPGDEEDPVNKIYRQIIDNVAKSLPRPLDVKKHIVDRVISQEGMTEKIINLMFLAPDKQQQIDAALSEMSAHLTETIFASWSKIFGGNFSGRDIVLRAGIEPDKDGDEIVYLQLALKDGASHYGIAERSMGFRWFFSFLLFTLYRVVASGAQRPTIFLLDEPASNLHARAQMQLLESFPRIAQGANQIMYSTHSHYLINPEWLDQAFIISNDAIDYERVDDGNRLTRGRPTNVRCERYRAFVGKNPDKISYFQPVLDKLDVSPSKLDLVKPSVLVEGKGDYLLLEYGRRVLLKSKSAFAIVPTKGAGGMSELAGLFLGWGVPFAICFDSDKAGQKGRAEFRDEWGISPSLVLSLEDVDPSLKNSKIEDFLEDEDLSTIAQHFELNGTPSKSQIQLFFSEMLAAGREIQMSKAFLKRVEVFDQKLAQVLGL